jgi:hypothetical protein
MGDGNRIAEMLRDGLRCDRSGPLWISFLVFHRENEWIYAGILERCQELRSLGWGRYSTRTLISVMRYESDVKTGGQEVWIEGETRKVKLNDHHSPYYARMIIENHPEFWNFLELRASEGDPVEGAMPPGAQSGAREDVLRRLCRGATGPGAKKAQTTQ